MKVELMLNVRRSGQAIRVRVDGHERYWVSYNPASRTLWWRRRPASAPPLFGSRRLWRA